VPVCVLNRFLGQSETKDKRKTKFDDVVADIDDDE